jgi:chromosomal replication initiation ATPase DnaA
MTALDKLAQRINEEFNVNIFKHTRSRNVVDARSVFCYIVRTEYSLSLHAIAIILLRTESLTITRQRYTRLRITRL